MVSRAYVVGLSVVLPLVLLAGFFGLASRGRTGWVRVALLALVTGLTVGTCTHVEALLRSGLQGIVGQPRAFNLYWASLAVVDPLGALLLVTHSRAGLALTAAIMVSDIAVNLVAFGHRGMTWETHGFLYCQIGFGALVAVVTPLVWPELA